MQRTANKKYIYKPLSEKNINDSFLIPKVNYKDFYEFVLNI